MTEGARAYVNHPRGVTVENGRVTVSSIYDWFESDFVNADGSVLDHIRKYARPELLAALEGIERVSDDYDWSLNGIATRLRVKRHPVMFAFLRAEIARP